MKINIPVRFRNPWFWVGIVGVVLTALNISPESLTSWDAVGQLFVDMIANPFKLGSAALAILGVFVDPTTHSVSDSTRALNYKKPNKE